MFVIVHQHDDHSVSIKRPHVLFSALYDGLTKRQKITLTKTLAKKILPKKSHWFIVEEKTLPPLKTRDYWLGYNNKIIVNTLHPTYTDY